MQPLMGLASDSGRVGSITPLNLWLSLSDGVRAIVTNQNSLQTSRLVAAAGETRAMGGERVKQITPTPDGAKETTIAEDGETGIKEAGDGETETTVGEQGITVGEDGGEITVVAEGAGALQSLVQVVVDGAPPAGTMIPLLRPSKLPRVKPPTPLLSLRPHQITLGARPTTRGVRPTIPGAHPTIPGVHPVGAPQTTLGGPPTKPHQTKLPMRLILTRRGRRDGGVASRTVVGRAGVKHPPPRPSLA